MAAHSTTGRKVMKPRARKTRQVKGRKIAKANHRTASAANPPKRFSVSDLKHQLERRSDELIEAREQQAATAEILKVINASPGDLTPVFDIILEKAHSLCDVPCGSLQLFDDGHTRAVAVRGMSEPFEKFLRQGYRLDRSQPVQSVRPFQIDDLAKVIFGASHGSALRVAFELGGLRTMLSVPLVRDGVVFGRIVAGRQEVRPFSEHQIAVLQSFADQAVIAISNVELFQNVQDRTKELSRSLDDLRAAQVRLVQTEKLASLGQLTAGIAHEIKNPLNFVNNFSALSAELTDELNDLLKSAALSDNIRQDVDDLTRLLKDNLEKVVEHGKRADSIVKNMLLHSREGSGEHRSADINALVDDSLNLAYHGARAEKSNFNIKFHRDLDPDAGTAEVYPQEVTRALLNLISNGFYAATKRKSEADDQIFEPVLNAATRNLGDRVEIRIRDNGIGISPEVKDKMFNPFFTTKPAGEGTGLGLSMTYDIIVKQHGGRIDVETEPGAFTEFIVTLPRAASVKSRPK
jgi:signal transduction histidine kinase